jgi:hypothetical protein
MTIPIMKSMMLQKWIERHFGILFIRTGPGGAALRAAFLGLLLGAGM